MPAKFTNVFISGPNIGVSVPHGTDVVYDGGAINAREIGYQERDPVSLVKKLGLPEDTPPEALTAVLSALQSKKDISEEQKESIVKSSKLGAYLQNSANMATTISAIIQLSKHPALAQISSFFKSSS
ncbi:hypothetical protein [Pseudomonas sp. p99-361]|uniref:hypothetical protein n=1 Tax=Pseudomonas sp. p99-361 TaxID=2479852 RepID=UPI000F770114|nr:hypothetical protein [Pseudomonas sp. p99-361]